MNQSRLQEELQTNLSTDQEKWWFNLFRIVSVNETCSEIGSLTFGVGFNLTAFVFLGRAWTPMTLIWLSRLPSCVHWYLCG